MPFVSKAYQVDKSTVRPEKLSTIRKGSFLFGVHVKWSELSEYDRKRKSIRLGAKAIALATAAVLINPNGIALLGAPGEERSEKQVIAEGMQELGGKISMMDAKSVFETQYISPLSVAVNHRNPGKGIIGYFASWGAGNAVVQAGQDCLADSGYNTSPSNIRGYSNGDINPVAVMGTDNGSDYTVYPAAGDAKPLRFVINSEGNAFIPASDDNWTIQTLSANGHCSVTGMQYSYAPTDNRYDTPVPIS